MANVSVTGMPREAPGLKGALTEFRKHNREVGDALLNLAGVGTIDGKPADIEDPRPTYDPKDHPWPRLAYHADGRYAQAENQAEYDALLEKGFRNKPYPVPQVALEDPKVEKQRLIQDAADARALNSRLLEQMQGMQSRLDAIEAEKKAAPQPPGKRS